MESFSISENSFSKEELDSIQDQRDGLQDQKNLIQKEVIELHKFTVQRYANWRLSLANISFALAAAIIPLMFFSGRRPVHTVTFYLGFALLFLNGFTAYAREKRDVEIDLNGIGRVGKPEIYQTTVFVNLLNKTLFYKTRDSYEEYFKISNEYAGKSESEIYERAQMAQKINFWNEFHILLPVFASYLLSWEVLNIKLNGFLFGLFILAVVAWLYLKVEYKKAKKSIDEAKEWDIKIASTRSEYSEWWHNRFKK